MAATAVDIGWGSSLTYQSGFAAKITSIRVSNFGAREARETSHMSTTNGWRTYLPTDLKDPGEVTVETRFDKNAAVKTAMAAAAESVTVTAPVHPGGSSAFTTACSGFATNYEWDQPMDDVMNATMTIKFTGEPTLTDGS